MIGRLWQRTRRSGRRRRASRLRRRLCLSAMVSCHTLTSYLVSCANIAQAITRDMPLHHPPIHPTGYPHAHTLRTPATAGPKTATHGRLPSSNNCRPGRRDCRRLGQMGSRMGDWTASARCFRPIGLWTVGLLLNEPKFEIMELASLRLREYPSIIKPLLLIVDLSQASHRLGRPRLCTFFFSERLV